jgi:hypothetical protein
MLRIWPKNRTGWGGYQLVQINTTDTGGRAGFGAVAGPAQRLAAQQGEFLRVLSEDTPNIWPDLERRLRDAIGAVSVATVSATAADEQAVYAWAGQYHLAAPWLLRAGAAV